MKILAILAHPNPESFNHGLAASVTGKLEALGHEVLLHDLYREGFDPLLTPEELDDNYTPAGLLAEHCRDMTNAEGIIIIHPNWRDQPPAILKGWVDRVFRVGVAFRYEGADGEEGHPVGMLNAGKALVLNTSDCPQAAEEKLGDPLQTLWADCILKSCGVKEVARRNFTEVLFSSLEQREGWLTEAAVLASDLFSN